MCYLASEASARLLEKWDRLAADVARGSKNFSTLLHLVIMVMMVIMVIMMIVVMKVMEVIMMMVMMAGGDPTASLSIKDDWSMLFWCLKAENGGFTPALICFR